MILHLCYGLIGLVVGLVGGVWYGHMIAMRVINKATEPTPVMTPPSKK